MRDFSEEIGIALSSLVEYEAGRRIPRAGTISHIAEKLNIPPSALTSPLPLDCQQASSCLDALAFHVLSLHPDTRASAEYALKLLHSALQRSDDLFFWESHSAPPENPDDRFRYLLHNSHCPPPVYGILVEERRNDGWKTVASFAPFSDNRSAVLAAVFAANNLQLPPDQFFSDFFHEFFPVL